jgi:hypothetical protein
MHHRPGHRARFVATCFCLLFAWLAAGPASGERSLDEISIQVLSMTAHDRAGAVTTTRAKVFWREFEDGYSRVLMRLSDPPDMRGAALLMIEKEKGNDTFMYLPELKRVKRISGRMMSGSMFGTDFSYDDFQAMNRLGENARSEELDGRPVHVVASFPQPDPEEPDEEPSYVKMLSYVDQERCVPLRIDFFERGERLRKQLSTDPASIEKMGDVQVARKMEITDLRDDTRTELVVEEIEIDAEVSKSMFSSRKLEQRGSGSF